MNRERILGLIRHVMSALGPLIMYLGLADEAEWTALSGAVIAAIGGLVTVWAFIASWFAREKRGGTPVSGGNGVIALLIALPVLGACEGGKLTEPGRQNAVLACSAAQILAGAIAPELRPRHADALAGLCALIPRAPVTAVRFDDPLAQACHDTREAVTGPHTAAQSAARAAAGCMA